MLRILLTNDDGVFAPGIRALRTELAKFAHVTVVAPVSEQSAVGHGITLLHPLLVEEVWEHGERIGYAVEGKPADCVKLALAQLLDAEPDLVVSGLNAGSNAGINVLYSGTVAAAIEGAFFHVTSIAVSLEMPETDHFEPAARIARRVIEELMNQKPAKGELFNINIPNLSAGDPVGVRVAAQGLEFYRESYEERVDPRGRRYYWLAPDNLRPGPKLDTDLAALAARYVTITPLHFDLTAHSRLSGMGEWAWKPNDS